MDVWEVMEQRHSVRNYQEKQIPQEVLSQLLQEMDHCNREGEMHFQLVAEEPEAFSGFLAHYGKFQGVKNYIAVIGKKEPRLEEKTGYYGERLVLKAQELGLNTCWVALTFQKGKCRRLIGPGEKLVCVISLGYGTTQGKPHKSKPAKQVYTAREPIPEWFVKGITAALLAPTAMNQQRFRFSLSENAVKAEATGGFYSKVDLGIVKYHFELGAGKKQFQWG